MNTGHTGGSGYEAVGDLDEGSDEASCWREGSRARSPTIAAGVEGRK